MVRRTMSNVTTAVLVYYSIGRTISTKPNLTSYLHTFYYDITYCPNDDTNTTQYYSILGMYIGGDPMLYIEYFRSNVIYVLLA